MTLDIDIAKLASVCLSIENISLRLKKKHLNHLSKIPDLHHDMNGDSDGFC
jgi:hypothetical protein